MMRSWGGNGAWNATLRETKRSEEGSSVQDDERAEVGGPRDFSQTWASYMLAEQRALVARAEGILAVALAQALPGESREELDRWAQDDRRLAKEGLVELMDEEGETYHLHIDELEPEDLADRLRAERARSDWLVWRTEDRNEQVRAWRRERRSRTEPEP